MGVKPIIIDVDFKKNAIIKEHKVRYGDNVPLMLRVFDDGEPFILTTMQTITLVITRLDRQVIVLKGDVFENQATFNLGGKELAVSGTIQATAQFYWANGRVSTFNFNLIAEKDPISNYTPFPEEKTLIVQVLENGPVIIEAAQTATIGAIQAENVALGAAEETIKTRDVLVEEVGGALRVLEEDKAKALLEISNEKTDTEKVKNETSQAKEEILEVAEELKENGNYAKTEGDRAKAEADRLAGTDVAVLDNKINNVNQTLTTQLADTAKKSEVQSLVTNKAEKTVVDATNLRIDNLVIPLSPTNSNIEVTDSHVSLTRNKTFSSLSSRIEQVEKENYLPMKNIVTNGSFESGKTGWTSMGPGGVSSTESGVALVGTSSLKIVNTSGSRREQQKVTVILGHKYYAKASAYVTSFTSGAIYFRVRNSITNNLSFNNTLLNKWQTLSTIVNADTEVIDLEVGSANSSTYTAHFDGIIMINLTETFGAGNEPLVEEMDKLMSYFEGGWFDGAVSENKRLLKHLLDLSLQNSRLISELKDSSNVSKTPPVVGYIDNPISADFKGQAMVTLSYDDGRMNNYDLALPLHEKHGIPVTFNVISDRFDSPSFFSESITKNCFDRGVEIASHSHFHNKDLTTKTDEELHFEFSESQRLLNAAIGSESVETIAIPYSGYDDRVKAIARQYYKGVRVFSNLQNDIPPADRYHLFSRIAVGNTTTFEQLKSRIDEAVTQKKWCIIMLHGINNSEAKGLYDIDQKLLDKTLAYINSFGRDVLLPINTKDALKFSLGSGY
ncbi:polysaccharide deacetylase family protein [Psychrobacillus lasiicapitis]|uniref:NodB homology domain-containing protein n=1 Tax=Psychrobacillus lasiicapitis TaxID=1636719 RepID=A0A544TAC3_9BACI|nr:polysaccharide deacetylase family protein [Psychrobacillus lasiicapitis]TQR14405.1 hypothetical protein FG382_08075 [Psychrobacillus lasiicapitis]GGA31641.1 hypothetical protein GCM10011384_21460 [Psychrobacillus lasiicapitis]